MESTYIIKDAAKDEETIVNLIITYIIDNYIDKINISKLKTIEVVDKLDNNSSGRSVRDKIILSRRYGLDGVREIKDISEEIERNTKLKMLISTIYHELWHVSTWDKYETMYEYILNPEEDDIRKAYSYLYWIEYIAHAETIFMEVTDVMKKFCTNFVHIKWHRKKGGYYDFIKALPYYLIRSQYLRIFDELTNEIICDELRVAVYKFDDVSKQLIKNNYMDDVEKANVIKDMIKSY